MFSISTLKNKNELIGLEAIICYSSQNPSSGHSPTLPSMLDGAARVWLAWHQKRIAGFIWVNQLKGEICHLYIKPEFSRQGIGRALLNKAGLTLFSLGFKRINLRTQSNSDAVQFYQSLGWHLHQAADEHGYCQLQLPHCNRLSLDYGASRS